MRVKTGAGSGALPETSRRAARRPSAIAGSCSASRRDPVVHRRDAEEHRRAVAQRGGRRGGLEAAEVAQLAAAAQRAEHADHQPVHVEQRQAVGEDVVAGPRPGVGERVEVGGDARRGSTAPFGRPGGARRVDDQRGVLVAGARLGQLAAAGGQVDAPRRRGAAGSIASGARGCRRASTCSSSERPSFGLTGTSARPASSTADRGDDRLQRGLGPDRDALGAGERRRRPRRRPRAARRRSGRRRRPRRPARRRARGRAASSVIARSPADAAAARRPPRGRPPPAPTAAAPRPRARRSPAPGRRARRAARPPGPR